MIQRIQSLFLLLALILIISCYYFSLADFYIGNSDLYSFNLSGFKSQNEIHKVFALFLSGIIIAGISLVTIFLYKNRALQMRLCIYNITLLVVLNLIIFFMIIQTKRTYNALVYYQVSSIFPLIAAILTFFAYRNIRKDEILVKSYDRLR